MPSLTLQQIMDMHDEPVSSTTHELAREFLEVFEPGKPLDKEGFEDWIQLHSIKMTDIKKAVTRAIDLGWVEDPPARTSAHKGWRGYAGRMMPPSGGLRNPIACVTAVTSRSFRFAIIPL